jgi:inorganic pyrophosphatase
MRQELEKYKDIIGSVVTGKVDRPLGSTHPNFPDMIYPINYGYVDGVFAADGEEQDVYIFGANEPLKTYIGKVIAVYHRTNDIEDKWIVSVDGKDYSDEEILERIEFQEKYFEGMLLRK